MAMLIPSIDLMGGKVVQLVQGKKKALEFDDADEWVNRFSKYPLVQLIDLDAAMGTGSNEALVAKIAGRLPCQVGGGIRSVRSAQEVLACGAQRVIIGSALFAQGKVNQAFAEALATSVGSRRLVFALDARNGKVTTHGWQKSTEVAPLQMIQTLDAWCAAYLYTHVDTEGMLQGFPREVILSLRDATKHQFIAAGGIRSLEEVDQLDAMGVDAVVGMAIYTGLIPA
jgi:phosphoribosylformimino-5-aminoimidazole carboxamide ribotide isomerase